MASLPRLRFDHFELDEANASLMRNGAPILLPPKAFSVLCELARNAGKLTTKDAILDAVWGHRHVSESVIKSTIAQLRAAMDDIAAAPRIIETVPRRGYRFVAPLTDKIAGDEHQRQITLSSAPTMAVAPSRANLSTMTGRHAALARLHAGWKRAQSGLRQLSWIAGDAGLGKTTLVDHFVAEVGVTRSAHGQCVEQFGIGEPYLPILDALRVLSRQDAALAPLMRQVAPMWLQQMPWLIADADRDALRMELAGAGQERMLREFGELMERYSQMRPVLLVTEDLHWSDQGTLMLMEHFARRRGTMHVHWIATFRLTQVIAEEHPLQDLRRELRLHKLCDEMMLDPFSEQEVAAYVGTRTSDVVVSDQFIRALHAHTDGLPLFVANVIDALMTTSAKGNPSSAIFRADGQPLPVPDNLTGAIAKQIARLPNQARSILEAASICGMQFRAATVAELLGKDAAMVTDCCDDMVRRQHWLAEAGIVDLPDSMPDAKYEFKHAIYKHVLYHQLSTAHRVGLHRAAARALERHGTDGTPATSAELASHHELGREIRPALSHYIAAADNALAHYAPQDAAGLTDRAQTLIPLCPDSADRYELELRINATRGIAQALLRGIAAPETTQAFERVRELCEILPQTPERALLLNSAGWGLLTRSQYDGALSMAGRTRAIGESIDEPSLIVFGCNLAGVTLANMGRFQEAIDIMRRGLSACESDGPRIRVPQLFVDPESSMCANIAAPLVQLGMVDQAREMVTRALARVARVGQPMARLVVHWLGCAVAVRLDDVASADAHAQALEELIATTSIQQALGPARWFRGWVEIRRGRTTSGLALVKDGYSLYKNVGTFAGCSETLSYAAEALILDGRWDEAQAILDEANALVDQFGERLYVPELLLLRARVEGGRGDLQTARHTIELALQEARTTGARWPELRALVALAESPGCSPADKTALQEVDEKLVEGTDTALRLRARQLMEM